MGHSFLFLALGFLIGLGLAWIEKKLRKDVLDIYTQDKGDFHLSEDDD